MSTPSEPEVQFLHRRSTSVDLSRLLFDSRAPYETKLPSFTKQVVAPIGLSLHFCWVISEKPAYSRNPTAKGAEGYERIFRWLGHLTLKPNQALMWEQIWIGCSFVNSMPFHKTLPIFPGRTLRRSDVLSRSWGKVFTFACLCCQPVCTRSYSPKGRLL